MNGGDCRVPGGTRVSSGHPHNTELRYITVAGNLGTEILATFSEGFPPSYNFPFLFPAPSLPSLSLSFFCCLLGLDYKQQCRTAEARAKPTGPGLQTGHRQEPPVAVAASPPETARAPHAALAPLIWVLGRTVTETLATTLLQRDAALEAAARSIRGRRSAPVVRRPSTCPSTSDPHTQAPRWSSSTSRPTLCPELHHAFRPPPSAPGPVRVCPDRTTCPDQGQRLPTRPDHCPAGPEAIHSTIPPLPAGHFPALLPGGRAATRSPHPQ